MDEKLSNLIIKARGGDDVSFGFIVDMYDGLINGVVNKYAWQWGESAAGLDDLKQEAIIALYSAVCSYNLEQDEVTFGLYAKVCIRNRIISMLRKGEPFGKQEEELDSSIAEDPLERLIDKENVSDLAQKINAVLTPYEKSVFKLFVLDLSYQEIAVRLCKSEKSIDNAVYRIKSKLRKLI